MARYRTTVTETTVWSFPVEAGSLEEAHRKAEAALHGDDGEEPLALDGGPRTRVDGRSMEFETKEDGNG